MTEPVPSAAQGEQDDQRDGGQGQHVVREGQPRQQSPEQEVPVPPLLPPDERAVEEEGDEQQVEPLHLGIRRLLPQRTGHRQGEAGRQGNERSDTQPAQHEHQDADRRTCRDRREQVHPVGDRADRDERGELPEERVQGIARRMEHPELGGHHLRLGEVPEADSRQEGSHVDGQCDRGACAGRPRTGPGGRQGWVDGRAT